MGLFDVFKKKECCICGNEVGIIGNRKLADGNMCSKCAKKLSPWFEDRKESTVQQIQEQLAYRAQNEENLKSFREARVIGDFEKIHIEEVNGVPTRFFVTQFGETLESNPDIISFRDVVSCVTDVNVRDEEIKQKNSEGQMVSYNPRRYKHHHNFIIRMEIRNNPWFDKIHFTVNSGVVTLETVGDVGGSLGGAALSGLLKGIGVSTAGMQTDSYKNSQERRRYEEYRMMCEKIEQAVKDGKQGGITASANADPILDMIEQLRNAPDMNTVSQLQMQVTMMIINHPNYEIYKNQIVHALTEATMRIDLEAAGLAPSAPAAAVTPPVNAAPKFCPGCGSPTDGGKFCQFCGTKLF